MQRLSISRHGLGIASRRGRDIRILTISLLVLLLVVVWGLVGLLVHLQFADADRAASRQAQALAEVLAPKVTDRLSALESLAGGILARMDADAPREAFETLAQEADLPQEATMLTLLDRQGQAVASSGLAARAEAAALVIRSRGQPMRRDGWRVEVRADASRLLGLAAGQPFGREAIAVLAQTGGDRLGAFPGTTRFTAGADATAGAGAADTPGWLAAPDGVRRHWASIDLPQHSLRLWVAVVNEQVDDDLRRRATLVVAAAAIESCVAIALAMLVLAQARRRDRLMHRLHVGRRKLRLANLAKTRFLESISHELRTPLNGILCTSELMVQLALNDEQAEIIDIISQSASELANMIDMLIDVAELQSGSASPARVECGIRQLIEDAGKKCLSSIWSRGGSLTLRWAPSCPHRMRIDAARTTRIVGSLLDSAGNACTSPVIALQAGLGAPGELHLRVSVQPSASDESQAWAPPVMQSAFDDGDLKAALGLLLLEDLVTTLGGRLSISVEAPRLHVIDLWLPADDADPSAAHDPTLAPAQIAKPDGGEA